jgi:hypothetical protein
MTKEIEITKNNYFKINALSSSLIKNLNKYEEFKINNGMIIGSIVDFYATENMDEFKNNFWINKIENIPRKQIKEFSDYVFENEIDNLEKKFSEMKLSTKDLLKDDILIYKDEKVLGYFIISDNSFEQAFKKVGFKKKNINSVLDEFYQHLDYYRYKIRKHLFQNNEKMIITDQDIKIAKNCFENILDSQFKKFFVKNNKNLELYHQVEIYWENKCMKKSKIDILFIDHEEKIIGIKDLKTMYDYTVNFLDSFIKYRYDIQMNHYYESLKFLEKAKCNYINLPDYIKDLIKKGYKYSNQFGFIVASTKKECLPLEFYFNVSSTYVIKNRKLNTDYDISNSINIYNKCIENKMDPSLTNYYNYILNGRILCN